MASTFMVTLTRRPRSKNFSNTLLGANTKSWWALPGMCCALLAATFAAQVVWPRGLKTVDPLKMRMTYLGLPPQEAKLKILDTRVANYVDNETTVAQKYKKFRRAVLFLVIAIAVRSLGV